MRIGLAGCHAVAAIGKPERAHGIAAVAGRREGNRPRRGADLAQQNRGACDDFRIGCDRTALQPGLDKEVALAARRTIEDDDRTGRPITVKARTAPGRAAGKKHGQIFKRQADKRIVLVDKDGERLDGGACGHRVGRRCIERLDPHRRVTGTEPLAPEQHQPRIGGPGRDLNRASERRRCHIGCVAFVDRASVARSDE